MARKEKRYDYNEVPTLLWLLTVSVISASLAVVGFVIESYIFKIGFFALAIILLCVVFSVLVVAILAPYVSEFIMNSSFAKNSNTIGEEKNEHKIIIRDSESLEE